MELPRGWCEVVVVDDASRDDTEQVCGEMIGRHGADRVRYFRLQSNAGAPTARNRGTAEARGDYIMFIDSDDVPVVAGIETLLSELERRPDLDFAYGTVVSTDENLHPLAEYRPSGLAYRDTDVEISGYHWCIHCPVYRRELIQRVGLWNTRLSGSQDWEYQARVKIARARGDFMDVLVGYWRRHGGERVGAKGFRPDYLESVMLSAEAVLQHAEKAGRADAALRRRLAKRLLVHAFEWGANGRTNDKRRCCRQARETAPDDGQIRILSFLIANAPQFVDRWWCRRLERGRRLRLADTVNQ